MKKIFLLLFIIFIFLNLFAVSAQENETVIVKDSEIIPDNPVIDENTAVSIETSISNSSIYIGNSTEVTVTVKNVGNNDINNLRIENIQTLDYKYYDREMGLILSSRPSGAPDMINTLHLDKFESINASWNYEVKSGDTIYFNLQDTLKVNETCGFKLIFNTTKSGFYDYVNFYCFAYHNNTILNNTGNKIKIFQIPRTVYITRKIENDTLIIDANVSSLDNSVFSGTLPVKIADNIFSPTPRELYLKEVFDETYIKFVNNTGTSAIKLPLSTHEVFPPGVLIEVEWYNAYSYNFIYDSFDEMLVQTRNFPGAKDLVKIYKNDTQFVVDARKLSCDNITFKVNGVSYVRDVNESGFAKLNINLNPGVYTIESFTHNYQFNKTITVLPTIIADNLVKYYKNDSQFYVKLVDFNNDSVASQNVTFNINGVFYTRQTNDDGIACLNINLNPGEYIITVIDPLTGLQMSYNITVLPVLYGMDVISYYGGTYDYLVKLVDEKGNALPNQIITFNINGLIYNSTTDANGKARLFVSLMPGRYIVTAKYLSSEISNNIVILEH
ncbi:hypothetical protein [uncultured Methanobrevibacter sp.]|uniref:hypothetical protein n=1 Tax=uncultured Methanobrevibacter sp. TaxID=253161 RepID=UPI0025E98540|nr:hypothetical protein [uncultured Methanobrevibacter sp.]